MKPPRVEPGQYPTSGGLRPWPEAKGVELVSTSMLTCESVACVVPRATLVAIAKCEGVFGTDPEPLPDPQG